MKRTVVLLQGPSSFFFCYLADALQQRGAHVERVLFCPGDALFWGRRPATRFRGRPGEWPASCRELLAQSGATDIVGLGDGRDWHAAAYREARAAGVRVHVVEHGYLRPGWLTVEPDGTGGSSRFPRDLARLAALGDRGDAPEAAGVQAAGFAGYAAMDVAYNLANVVLGPLRYPHYRTHALVNPVTEWAGWIGKAVRWPLRAVAARRAWARLRWQVGPVFLFPLQLETDFQIRHHGPPDGLRATLARVVRSFAAQAPPGSCLVVKAHPLDNGLAPWPRLLAEAAGRQRDRTVIYLDGGDAEALMDRLAGVVTVNSTVGLTALRRGIPVRALGKAIYDLPGLTSRQALDEFWGAPAAPDPAAVQSFVRALKATIQVPGSFDGPGAPEGAARVAERILAPVDLAAPLSTTPELATGLGR